MKLVLLDAHALIHRAYHAIPHTLTSPNGEPTNATYGFASTLLRVMAEEKPDYVAAAFDVGRSFRHDQFAEYKATRPALADDLGLQLKRSREVAEAFGLPTFGVERYEADDLLGTLAKQASAQGVETVIVTGDTDTFQLIGPHVSVLTFSRQFGDLIRYDLAAIKERYDLEPTQLIDFKALKGDPSDNIPGIVGVGDKTATKLVQTFGTIEGIYQHLDEVDKRVREKLAAAQEQALRGKRLVTIVTDAPIKLDLEACRVTQYDRERVVALFRQLGFRSLVERLPGPTTVAEIKFEKPKQEEPTAAREDYHTVDTEAALDQLVRKLQSGQPFVVDVETTDVDAMRAELVGIAIGVGGGEAYYVPIQSAGAQGGRGAREERGQMTFNTNPSSLIPHPSFFDRDFVLAKLKPIFENASVPKYAHNAKYDATVLAEAGVELRGIAFDSMVAAHLVEPNGQSVGLKNLVWAKFGVEMTEIEALIGKGKHQISMAEVDVAQVSRYACADVDYTWRLVELYKPILAERGLDKLFQEVEMPLVPVLVEMERTGVLLDVEFLQQMSAKLKARLQELETQITEQCGGPLNIASPQQLADALFNKLGLSTVGLPRTKTGQISTAADVLDSLRGKHPVIGLILEHRELAKLKGTYVDALPALINPKTGRVHTDYNQTGAVTGRVSSSNPNLQNIPIRTEIGRQVRRAFIAPHGSQLISADYSQVELRILAHISRDAGLLQAFANGQDIHAATAARLYNVTLDKVTSEMRRVGKTINFGIAYGITGFGISARTDLSPADAQKMIDQYFAEYPQIKVYVEQTKREARERGFVKTPLGRRRYFPELAGGARVHPSVRGAAEREAVNMPIQGSAADIIKIAMVRLNNELHARGLRARMTLQVHDELVLQVPEDEIHEVASLVCEVMENAYPLDPKLKVDVSAGQNWDGMLPVEA
ncbi:MAG: DNA polymerase I [Chloroflexi bacterium]|nr:DNA polymerase I [Chloroflexota bacterium]